MPKAEGKQTVKISQCAVVSVSLKRNRQCTGLHKTTLITLKPTETDHWQVKEGALVSSGVTGRQSHR